LENHSNETGKKRRRAEAIIGKFYKEAWGFLFSNFMLFSICGKTFSQEYRY
jgi:hypothetical protein